MIHTKKGVMTKPLDKKELDDNETCSRYEYRKAACASWIKIFPGQYSTRLNLLKYWRGD